MPRVKITGNQLTLPEELRRVLFTAEDGAIDAEETEEGVLLKRSPGARRRAALGQIRDAQSGVRYRGPMPRPPADREEQEIGELIAADKADRRKHKRR